MDASVGEGGALPATPWTSFAFICYMLELRKIGDLITDLRKL